MTDNEKAATFLHPSRPRHCTKVVKDGRLTYQCRREAVAGPGKLYCKQHVNLIERQATRWTNDGA